MKSAYYKINTKFVSLDFLIKSIWVYFIIKMVFFAIKVPLGMSPDEGFHFNQILNNFHSTNLFLETVDLKGLYGRQNENNFFYHWAIGKLLNLNVIGIDKLLFVRFINVFLGFVFLIYANKLFDSYFGKGAKIIKVLFNLILTNTFMLTFLFGMVSYDNLINFISVFSIYHLCKFQQNKQIYHILISIPFLAIGVLSKISFYAFAFLFVGLTIYLFVKYFKQISFTHQLRRQRFLVVVAFLFSMLTLSNFGNRYSQYGNWNVNCLDLYSAESCTEYDAIYARNKKIKSNFNPARIKYDSYISYLPFWFKEIFTKIFEFRGHVHYYNSPISILVLQLILLISCALSLIFLRHSKFQLLFSFLVGYIFILSYFANYKIYLSSGMPNLALQGRYIFPLFVGILIFSAKGFDLLLSPLRKYLKIIIVLTLGSFVVWQEFPSFLHFYNYVSVLDKGQMGLRQTNNLRIHADQKESLILQKPIDGVLKGVIYKTTNRFKNRSIPINLKIGETTQSTTGEINRNSLLIIKFNQDIQQSMKGYTEVEFFLKEPIPYLDILKKNKSVYTYLIK